MTVARQNREAALDKLKRTHFDVVVVGAGIHGAGIAWEAARRGLTVALVEQVDFGHAASANSLKIIHGGFRYLQSADFARMRQSIRARRDWLRLAPHLVRPLPCLVPTHGWGLRSRAVFHLAFAMNDWIAGDRNRGLDAAQQIPSGRVLSRAALHECVPTLPLDGLTGGALWFDAIADDTERLTVSVVLSARDAGAVVMNHLRALAIQAEDGSVMALKVQDTEGGGTFEMQTRAVAVAAGPWRHLLQRPAGVPDRPQRWVKAVNVIVNRRLFGNTAVGLEARLPDGKRNLFFAPWREGTLIGTLYRAWAGKPDDFAVGEEDVDALLRDVHVVHPQAGLTADDITFVHGGLLPAKGGSIQPESQSRRYHGADVGGLNGLVLNEGVKYTTGLEDARAVVNTLVDLVGKGEPSVPPDKLYGGPTTAGEIRAQAEQCGLTLDPDVAERLLTRGSCSKRILELAAREPGLAERLAPDSPVLKAEIVLAVRDEMATTLADVVLRRTGLGTFREPPPAVTETVAGLLAGEWDWSRDRVSAELSALKRHYPAAIRSRSGSSS